MATFNSIDCLRTRLAFATRLALSGALVLGAALLAAAAGASEVVDLRIGAHTDFTRVVFELDTPAGYRIERSASGEASSKLVVSIDASSIPRRLQSTKSLIGLVTITPKGDRSIAEIELTQKNLSLKEMILANPPRIVLDVLSPASAKAKPATPIAVSPPVVAAKPVATAKPALAPKPAASPPPPPKAVAEVKPPTASKPAIEPAPGVRSEPAPPKQPDPIELARATPKPPAAPVRPPAPLIEPSEGGVPTMGMEPPPRTAIPEPRKMPDLSERRSSPPDPMQAPRPTPSDLAKKVSPTPAPIAKEPSLDLTRIGLGLAAVVLLVGGVYFVRRRRGGAEEEFSEDVFEAADAGGDNPFAGFATDDSPQPALGLGKSASRPLASHAGALESGGIEIELEASERKDDESVGARSLRQASMSLDGGETQIKGLAQSPATEVAGMAADELQGSEEIMKLLQEFERRVSSLETRLDEVLDARERLERQVAAQTEELRVQRAAIARTQRAVRNMSRPEDEGPTEPALRDPQ